jgi:hypothetical protein
MKKFLIPASLLILAVVFSLGAFAKEKSTSVTLTQDASNATVKFVKGKKEVASATGQVKTLAKKPVTTHLTYGGNGNTEAIQEIEFGGSDTSVTFGNAMGAGGQ